MLAMLDALGSTTLGPKPYAPWATSDHSVSPRLSLANSEALSMGSVDVEDSDWDCPCGCSRTMGLLRTLHVEGLPPAVTAAKVSELMAGYGIVQYAEAAPEVMKDSTGAPIARRVHCYIVFTDHVGACNARKALTPRSSSSDGSGTRDQALRVRFAKPQNLVPSCTPAFRSFVAAQWAQVAQLAKSAPDGKKQTCRVNALFVSKLHQHITTARLNSLYTKHGPMIACEVQYHSDGRSAGHGVVIYENIEDAERALLATDGYRLEGRTIEVTPLRLKKLPSKLEHLKNRIKRLPLPNGELSSDEGSMTGGPMGLPSPSGTPPGSGPAKMAAFGLPRGALLGADVRHMHPTAQQPPGAYGLQQQASTAAAAAAQAAALQQQLELAHLAQIAQLQQQAAAAAQVAQLQQLLAAQAAGGAPLMDAAHLQQQQAAHAHAQNLMFSNGLVLPRPAGTLPPGLDLSFL